MTVSLQLKRIGSEEHLNSAFTYFDKNQSGYIEIDELRDALADDAVGPDREQAIHDIIRDVDLDKVKRLLVNTVSSFQNFGCITLLFWNNVHVVDECPHSHSNFSEAN